MRHKILKNGNSLAVTIPADFAKTLGLKPGQVVQTEVNLAAGMVTYTFENTGQLSLLTKPKKS